MVAVSPAGLQVTNANWQTPPQLAWAFQHIADLFPVAAISRGLGPVAALTPAGALGASTGALGQVVVTSPYDGTKSTVEGIIGTTWTDGWAVLHDGQLVAEGYANDLQPGTLHLLMSVSKSLVGCVAGALVASGALDVEGLVTTYLPELATSGYAGATVRHLLDMRSGIAFSEAYLDEDAEVRVLEEAIGWAPARHEPVPDGMHEFLKTLRQKAPHGGAFEYRSCETDVLGWVCEAAAGIAMPQLMTELLWARLGCESDANIGLDAHGDGMFDGGISTTLRDLARFAEMVRRGGVSLTGEQVVPEAWVADSYAGGPDSRAAFDLSPDDNRMPGGMYRNQFWFPFPDRDVLLCLGIHGQMVYVNPAADVVAVKLSSWPTPQNAHALFATVAAFDAISVQLSLAT